MEKVWKCCKRTSHLRYLLIEIFKKVACKYLPKLAVPRWVGVRWFNSLENSFRSRSNRHQSSKTCRTNAHWIQCNLLIPRPSWRTSKLQEKSSALKREHPELENLKFLPFFIYVGHFCPPRSVSSRPKSMRIHSDPDPKHWYKSCLSNKAQF